MQGKLAFLGKILLAALLEVFVYIVLHEGGHALTALACGAEITAFSIFGAFTGWVGGRFTPFTEALCNAAGMGLPVLISVFYMVIFLPRTFKRDFFAIFSTFFALMPAFSLLAWAAVPLASLGGSLDANDDIVKFLAVSRIPPPAVTAAAALLFAAMVLLARKKGVLRSYAALLRGKMGRNPS